MNLTLNPAAIYGHRAVPGPAERSFINSEKPTPAFMKIKTTAKYGLLKGRADLMSFLAVGVTTRQDVMLRLGPPSGRFENEKILTYRLGYEPKNQGYYVVEREGGLGGWPTWLWAKFSLVLVFNEAGVLEKHSLVEVN
jgi:hypothetical protein